MRVKPNPLFSLGLLLLMTISTTHSQSKSTEKAPFDRPSLSNSTKPVLSKQPEQRTNSNLPPSATYKLYSHENYTMPDRDTKAEDLNIENYYTLSIPAGTQSVVTTRDPQELKFEVTFILANQTRGVVGYFATTKDYYLNKITIEVDSHTDSDPRSKRCQDRQHQKREWVRFRSVLPGTGDLHCETAQR